MSVKSKPTAQTLIFLDVRELHVHNMPGVFKCSKQKGQFLGLQTLGARWRRKCPINRRSMPCLRVGE